MNEILQIAKMVLSLEQYAFIVKRYFETHLLKHVCDDSIQKFPNSVSLFNRVVLNLIQKSENNHLLA